MWVLVDTRNYADASCVIVGFKGGGVWFLQPYSNSFSDFYAWLQNDFQPLLYIHKVWQIRSRHIESDIVSLFESKMSATAQSSGKKQGEEHLIVKSVHTPQ